ncbi:3-deoxy-D-manno-octulosonic acid transferase [Ramlibacter alkalitolerans]|uniref:3-deoxy-D-manno-octulosonic acid transferase n=1 Tax=Ramlibacter alkalitolerans TaxID=2039631 RepID=A0ABS1JJ15_9BURK|nr:3-deoxy-D-manno-octulosonic acid transferase [Ramlibacter alkalitolerans]MBL0424209.1 3-deoxy-D-manno-octulosonic acid transferase [Ramlibacter alkalitolerans]
MIRPLYSLVLIGAQPLLRRKLRRRGAAEPGYLEHVEERFGRYEAPTAPGRLWIHAVSLGETRAAAILVDALRRAQPGLRILLTHGTATGRAEGQRLLREGDAQAWLPWDTPPAVRRFLDHFRPAAGILMETEVWPNLAAQCHARGIPLALANARLSEKSLSQARRLAGLSRPAYGALRAVWAQTQNDARRLAEAGATVQGVFGNLKFDASPDPALLAQGRDWRSTAPHPVVMFASSREGEEAQFLQAIAAHRDVQWLLVPRHPQRFDEVAALAAQAGFTVSRRSTWDGAPVPAQVWIGDSLGEMSLYYALADAALLGGSFAPLGGQNLIEAAACGCPVVMGPHTFNFSEAAQLAQQAGAAQRAASMQEGVRAAVELVRDRQARARAVEASEAFAAAHRGAADKTARAVLKLLAG